MKTQNKVRKSIGMPELSYKKIVGIFLLFILLIMVCRIFFTSGLSCIKTSNFQVEKNNPPVSSNYLVPDGIIDINDAEAGDLLALPGIGETIAGNIITERMLNGPFYYPEDLLSVKGIGKYKLNQIRDYISFTLYDNEEIGE